MHDGNSGLVDCDIDIDDIDSDVETKLRPKRHRKESRRLIRSRTISVKRITKEQIRIGKILYPETDYWKPQTRGDCSSFERPCPFVSCKHHLYLDVNQKTGSIKFNFPDLEVWEMAESCSLDVADRGGVVLTEAGELVNLTRERIRQIEVLGLESMRTNDINGKLRDHHE